MVIHETKHARWGSNLADQTSADQAQDFGEDGRGYKTVTVPRLFFKGYKQKRVYVGFISRPARDDEGVTRYFHHRCGLLRIMVAVDSRGRSRATTLLDGHPTSCCLAENTEYRFAPEYFAVNDGKPFVDIYFGGKGKRFGPLDNCETLRVVYTFADEAQMNQYLVRSERKLPRTIRHKNTPYYRNDSGLYVSSGGDMLSDLLLLYLMLSDSERGTFLGENPEAQTMLEEASPEDNASNEASLDENAAESDHDHDSDGGSTDSDSGGYDSGSDSGSGDSGGSDSGGGGE